MNKTRLPGQSWRQLPDGRWRCSFCGRPTRDRYGHNQHRHNPDAKPEPQEEEP